MFKEHVKGLEDVIEEDIPLGAVILITGGPGTLKSGFTYNLLSNYLQKNNDEFGVYAILEEPKESHLRNMESLGIEKPENFQIFDYADIRKEWREEEPELNMTQITEDVIKFYKEEQKKDFVVFALDSLNALHSLTTSKNPRRDSYHLFTLLRDYELTSFITAEIEPRGGYMADYFMTDGVIEVGITEVGDKSQRYFQLRKLRATDHSMEKHQLTVEKDGLSIAGPIYK